MHGPSGDDSIVKCHTVVHHQIIVHHTEARGLIALSTEHRGEEIREGGKRVDTDRERERERTFDKIA